MPSSAARPLAARAGTAADIDAAYRRCAAITKSHYENFPVISRLLARDARRALAAVYAFARAADDMADEGHGAPGPTPPQRLAALDGWERDLLAVCRGGGLAPVTGDASWEQDRQATFTALPDAIARHAIPVQHFLDLLSAFRQDVRVSTYQTREELLDYCRRSANPVGRIVLAVHGLADPHRAALSDHLCTGLQLANFWQDISVDLAKGRVYVPRQDLERHGLTEADLARPAASPSVRRLVLDLAGWTRTILDSGRPLLGRTPSMLGLHLRLVWHGGARILEKIVAVEGDVLAKRPKLGLADAPRLLVRALAMKGTA
jgi:squalene synthase HpnC